jgi:hypothetical protein
MPKFIKKPVVVEAFQLTQEMVESHLFDNVPLPGNLIIRSASYNSIDRIARYVSVAIKTSTGFIPVDVGDWIVKYDEGERHPCKPDVFEATYEPAE